MQNEIEHESEKKKLCALCCADVDIGNIGGTLPPPHQWFRQHQEPGNTPSEIPTPSPPESPPNTEHEPVKEPPSPEPGNMPTEVPPMRHSAMPHARVPPRLVSRAASKLPEKSSFWVRDIENVMKAMFS